MSECPGKAKWRGAGAICEQGAQRYGAQKAQASH